MNLSVQLAELLQNGLPIAGDFLAVDAQLINDLRSRIHTQEPGGFMFDGAPASGESLWLAHNVRSAEPARRRLSRVRWRARGCTSC